MKEMDWWSCLTTSMSDLLSTLSDREYIVKPHTPKIGMTVKHRILNNWNRLPLSVRGFTRQRGPEKDNMCTSVICKCKDEYIHRERFD